MSPQNIDAFARSLDILTGVNEFNYGWRDLELTFNYFHAADGSSQYGSFADPNHRMLFNWSTVTTDNKNHIDMYLNHPADSAGYDRYKSFPFNLDPQEDNNQADCDEVDDNDISVSVGYRGYRPASAPDSIRTEADPTWFQSASGNGVRINHESQHLMFASRGVQGNTKGFPDEALAMGAEYLSGASARDSARPVYNSVYDWPLVLPSTATNKDVGVAYSHWYLWMAYLLQQFGADSTRIDDDLVYKWVRQRDAGGNYNNQMWALAKALEGGEYAGLGGSTGAERLRNLVHNYALAKWINNPSSSFFGGRYGFTRGIVPSHTPGLFDNSYNPCDRYSAIEVPPRFAVGAERVGSDSSYAIGARWNVTDPNQTWGCDSSRAWADTIGVWLYGSDYLQFDAGSYFQTNGKQNTLAFRVSWDPTMYPGGGSKNSLRVAAISYAASTGDSLYLKGASVTGITYAFVDSLHGFAQVWVPNFGGTTKSVVIAIDMGEVAPPSGGQNPRKLYYGYSFRVDEATPGPLSPISLTAAQTSNSVSKDYVSLQWSDPGACGTSGYTIQRSTRTMSNFVTRGSVPAGTFQFSDSFPRHELNFYRVLPTGAPACSSNTATSGGYVEYGIALDLWGRVYLGGDLAGDATATVNVLKGTTVLCRTNDSRQTGYDPNKVEVVLQGKLLALGASADSIRWTSASTTPVPGDWRGIALIGAGTVNSRLEYNAIAYAVHGVNVQGNSPQPSYGYDGVLWVDHSSIRHSQFYGFWAANMCSATVVNSVFEQNHGAEIGVTLDSDVDVRNCFLHYDPSLGSGPVDDGIAYTVGSAGWFRRNRVAGVGMGVYCLNGSSPYMFGGDSTQYGPFGRNDILNFRNYGVRTYDEGIPELGTGTSATGIFAGRNNIYSSAFPGAVWIDHSSQIEQLKAKHNYWGAVPPDASRFVGDIVGYSNQQHYLASFDAPAGPNPNQYYPGYQGAAPLPVLEGMLVSAQQKEATGDIAGAIAAYRDLVVNYPWDAAARWAIGHLARIQIRQGRAADEAEFVGSVISSNADPALTRLARRLQPRLLLRAGLVPAALNAYESILSDRSYDRPGVLLELALQKAFVLEDPQGARDAVQQLQAANPDYYLLKHARAMLQGVVGSEIWIELPEPNAASAAPSRGDGLGFALHQNAPNPMNPRTRIAFSIPKAGSVLLRVFDVRGRLVRTLAEVTFSAGDHVVEWNGTDSRGTAVSSGVYYYRLEALGTSATRKLIVLK